MESKLVASADSICARAPKQHKYQRALQIIKHVEESAMKPVPGDFIVFVHKADKGKLSGSSIVHHRELLSVFACHLPIIYEIIKGANGSCTFVGWPKNLI